MLKTLSDALAERGYDTLTAVQEAVTAPELHDADLLVSAQTGSGKTVGFGLAIAGTLFGDSEQLEPAAAPLALVVAPTRELALQVMRELGWLYAKAGARVVSCIGGMDSRDERRALDRGAHIVVGTPGRLRDHIERGALDMSALRAIVLDEADEMLDLGFRDDLEYMLSQAPDERRTLLFSATVPPSIAALARQFQRDAVRVTTLTGTSQHADITYQALRVAQSDAEIAIINVLRFHEAQNALVFANTRAAVNRLTARFANRGFAVVSLSGELSQTERTHALQAMRDGRARVCVATDVAARGIDLPNLELVVHAELPQNSEALLHRSGRTGRAGRKGISALIVPPKITKKAERLLKFANITAEWTTAPAAEDILRRDEERLLADPVWTEDITEEQAAFAAKLLERHTPETIAAAYLRLYREGHTAPEDLSAPDTRPAAKERKPFGPSAWVALSVGRKERAEPRWLLPLLCTKGGLDKDSIGAIRVQQSETFVELTEPSLQGFLATLKDGSQLEEGVTVRQLEGAPDFSSAHAPRAPSQPRPRTPRADDDHKRHGKAVDRQTRVETVPSAVVDTGAQAVTAPAAPIPEASIPAVAEAQPASPVQPARSTQTAPERRAPAPRPETRGPTTGTDAPERKPRHQKPSKPARRSSTDAAPARPDGKRFGKPGGNPSGRPGAGPGGKPAGKPTGARKAPYADASAQGKPGKGAAASYRSDKAAAGAKPAASAKPGFDASDTSKRVVRPGKPDRSKPGGPKGKPRSGGNAPPRRKG